MFIVNKGTYRLLGEVYCCLLLLFVVYFVVMDLRVRLHVGYE